MINSPLITIYTPTYNRKNLLPRLYDSLCNQTCKNFIWLVVDDGSSDGTGALINLWKQSSPFQIEYVYKENGGVHTAREIAFEIAKTELLWGVDSDDWLINDAVEKVQTLWNKKKGTYLGIFALDRNVNKLNQTKFPLGLKESSYQDLFCKYKVYGDIAIIIRTDVIKKTNKFPVYSNEKLVSESYKWFQLPDEPFLILNDFTTNIEYQDSGYSSNVRKNWFKNLNGYCDLYNNNVKHAKYLKKRVEYCIKYIIACSFLKKGNPVYGSSRPILTAILYPLGLLAYYICKRMWVKR